VWFRSSCFREAADMAAAVLFLVAVSLACSAVCGNLVRRKLTFCSYFVLFVQSADYLLVCLWLFKTFLPVAKDSICIIFEVQLKFHLQTDVSQQAMINICPHWCQILNCALNQEWQTTNFPRYFPHVVVFLVISCRSLQKDPSP